MLDDNWDLINGPAAHHIEQLNAANTINMIESLVTFLTYQKAQGNPHLMLTELALKELHRAGTLFLLSTPGQYRTSDVVVADGNNNVVYEAPPWREVPGHMVQLFAELGQIWQKGDALDAAAFALWRINWVHPFKNGNGRTARCFSYACLCGHLGVMVPGAPTVIDQIMMTRPEYEAALRSGDAAVTAANPNGRDLQPMKAYLDRLLQIQINSVP